MTSGFDLLQKSIAAPLPPSKSGLFSENKSGVLCLPHPHGCPSKISVALASTTLLKKTGVPQRGGSPCSAVSVQGIAHLLWDQLVLCLEAEEG